MSHDAPNASINDLLRYEDEEIRKAKRPPRRWGWIGKALLQAAALTALVIITLRVFGVTAPMLLVFSGFLALVLLRKVLSQVDVLPSLPSLLRPPMSTTPVQDGLAVAAGRWETRLSWTQADPERFSRTVHRSIVDLANERLRQRHSCTITSDPARARELLGTPLWTFLTTRVERPVAPRDLAAVIARLEDL